MIVDASAVLAILFEEAEAETFADVIAAARRPRISAVNYVEAAIAADRFRRSSAKTNLDSFVRSANLVIEPVTQEHALSARAAYARYGKGRHPARLNLGDCFAYALASTSGEPLLFKGNDFSRTDVAKAI